MTVIPKQPGFSPIVTVISLAIGLGIIGIGYVIATGGYLATRKNNASTTPTPTAQIISCTLEAKLCPDGSYVSRQGTACEFVQCPGDSAAQSLPENWKTYTSEKHGFTIKHPEDVLVRDVGTDGVNFFKVEPSQAQNTEFYDGISLTINSSQLFGKLQDIAGQKMNEFAQHGEIVLTLQPIRVGALSGYTFKGEGVGKVTYIFLPKGPEQYIQIVDATQDPKNLGFNQVVTTMLSSITVTQ